MKHKKFFVSFATFCLSLTLVSCDNDEESSPSYVEPTYPTYEEESIVFHYSREDESYDSWALWIWLDGGGEGAEYEFNGVDSFGVAASYPLSTFGADTTSTLGFIVKSKGSWDAKDVDSDRFIDLSTVEMDENQMYHVYLKQGDSNVYLNSDLVLVDTINLASFTSYYNINVETSNPINNIRLLENGVENRNIDLDDVTSYTLSLAGNQKASIESAYIVEVTFTESGQTLSQAVSMTTLYSTSEFGNEYNYSGELGAIYTSGSTTFKVWSPVSSDIKLRIYDNGTPTSVNSTIGSDVYSEYTMTKGDYGVFEYTLSGDQEGKYYTFVVTNAYWTSQEVVDPYAYSTGVNGLRGMVVDFEKTNPTGWEDVTVHPYDRKELTVYETHVSDITSSDTWGGTEAYSKLFKGAYETGTKYHPNDVSSPNAVTTGFDHIKELGVNAVQLVPIFDQSNDEVNMSFNWGYNPLNYNTLEGGYSTDPYDGYTRIKEFKELVMAYNAAGINIIMDVVYNHVYGVDGSNFDVLMPGYYFRYNSDGSLSNGSGVGNETASEMYMFRKFMLDSTEFWASEYKLGGFRFDLMALHDLRTMNNLVLNLIANVNANIVVYGEPWMGGSTTLSSAEQSSQSNANQYNDFGQFNDNGRDALIKGGLSSDSETGWVTNNSSSSSSDWSNAAMMIKGMTNESITDPDKTVNYVTCHDNYTLYDRIQAAGISDAYTTKQMATLANSIVLTSQGTSFFLAGEEFLRTKQGNSNSYNASYEVNELDYSLKYENQDLFETYQKLIAFKQNVDGLHLDSSSNQNINVTSLDGDYNSFMYSVTDSSAGRTYTIIHKNGVGSSSYLNLSGYELYLSTVDSNKTLSSNTEIKPYETLIVYQ